MSDNNAQSNQAVIPRAPTKQRLIGQKPPLKPRRGVVDPNSSADQWAET